jgi:signal transduction histidine kinase/CheY-like chemotaxis protein
MSQPNDIPKTTANQRTFGTIPLWLWILVFLILPTLTSLVAATTNPTAERNNKPKVLVLLSYHYGMRWEDEVAHGLREVLAERAELVFVHYDVKRFPDRSRETELLATTRSMFNITQPSVVIAVEDYAWNLVQAHRKDLFSDIPVVFAGVNVWKPGSPRPPNATGVVESIDPAATVELALRLHPSARRVVIVNDTTETGKADLELLDHELPAVLNGRTVKYVGEEGHEAAEKTLAALNPAEDVVLMVSWNLGQSLPYDRYPAFIRSLCPAPIYGLWEFYFGDGIVGGALLDGHVHGKQAAEMAAKLLAGASTSDLPVELHSRTRLALDDRELRRFKVNPSLIPPDTEIINRPVTLWSQYWQEIIGIVIGVVLLLILLVILAVLLQQKRRLAADLDRRVKERTADLEAARIELMHKAEGLERAGRYKSEFLATMSHELRTPLNAILGYAQILQRDENLTPRQKDGIHTIRQSGDHLLNLITDILDLSKIEAGKLELLPTEFPLADVLRGVSAIVTVRAVQKGLPFIIEKVEPLPSVVIGDAKRLRQILINLLVNAVKFTERGQVRLRVSVPDASNPRVRFEISDSGIGMSPHQLDQIFKPFEQAGDKHQRSEGTGLGLAITKRLVELMGSTIHVESQPGVGSTFSFDVSLPDAGWKPHADFVPAEGVIVGYQGNRRRILIVDDHAYNRSVLRLSLDPLGFLVYEAQNGVEAIEHANQYHPDLILMDMMMPLMDGFDAVRRLRATPEFESTPIIAVSASVFIEDQHQVLAVGCQAFLSKPIDLDRLYSLLQQFLHLDWIHRKAEPVAPSNASTYPDQAIRTAFPASEVSAICEMAADGRMPPISDRLSKILVAHPDAAPFIHRLLDAVRQFDGDQVIVLLTPYLPEDQGDSIPPDPAENLSSQTS